jgi:hypothetical protein
MTNHSPQAPWLVLNTHSDADMFNQTFDPELQTLVETLTKRIASPLPSLSFTPLPDFDIRKSVAPGLPTGLRKQAFSLDRDLPHREPSKSLVAPTPYSASPASYPLPPASPILPAIDPPVYQVRPVIETPRSKDILNLLSLLDAVDTEMALECQHMRDSIAEIRNTARKYVTEREERALTAKKRLEKERRETKEVGGDFWAGV